MARFDKKLAAILAKHDVIDGDRRNEVLSAADEGRQSLSEYLIERKMATEADIIGAVSKETNLPPIDLEKYRVRPEAIDCLPEDVARHYCVAPVARLGRTLTIAVSDPMEILALDDIKIITGYEVSPTISTDTAIRRAIARLYAPQEDAPLQELVDLSSDEIVEVDEPEGSEEHPAIRLANMIVLEALKKGASEILIDPSEEGPPVLFKIGGEMQEPLRPPARFVPILVNRYRIVAGLNYYKRNVPQQGRVSLKDWPGSLSAEVRRLYLHVFTVPGESGEKILMKISDRKTESGPGAADASGPASAGQGFDVFISAKSQDYEYARQVFDYLRSHGVSVFFSEASLPKGHVSEFVRGINQALESARDLVLVTSCREHTFSQWVEKEWMAFLTAIKSERKAGSIYTVTAAEMDVRELPIILADVENFPLNPEGLDRLLAFVGRDPAP